MTDSTGIRSVDMMVVWCVALAAIIGLLGMLVRAVRKVGGRIGQIADDWNGEPPRPGFPGRPGVMERVGTLETEVVSAKRRLLGLERFAGRALLDAPDEGCDGGLLGRRASG